MGIPSHFYLQNAIIHCYAGAVFVQASSLQHQALRGFSRNSPLKGLISARSSA